VDLKNKLAVVVALATLTLGVYLGRTYFPKTQVVEKEVIKKDIQTVVKEIVRADGTKETVTTIVDNSTESSSRTVQAPALPKKWKVGATVDKSSILGTPVYGVQIDRRIIGPVFAGIKVNTDKQIGIGISVEF